MKFIMPKGISKNPEETRAKRKASLKKYWSNPEAHIKHSVVIKIAVNQPETKAKNRAAKLGENNPMKRPEVRARHCIIMKEVSSRPEVKAKRSVSQKLIQKELHSRPEVRAKWSISSSGENNNMFGVHRFGESAPNWKGGPARGDYPLEFNNELKEFIRERDNHICQLCDKTEEENGRKLDVHHIDYNKQNVDLENLITLCRRCHVKTNSLRDFWESYFSSRMEVYLHD